MEHILFSEIESPHYLEGGLRFEKEWEPRTLTEQKEIGCLPIAEACLSDVSQFKCTQTIWKDM